MVLAVFDANAMEMLRMTSNKSERSAAKLLPSRSRLGSDGSEMWCIYNTPEDSSAALLENIPLEEEEQKVVKVECKAHKLVECVLARDAVCTSCSQVQVAGETAFQCAECLDVQCSDCHWLEQMDDTFYEGCSCDSGSTCSSIADQWPEEADMSPDSSCNSSDGGEVQRVVSTCDSEVPSPVHCNIEQAASLTSEDMDQVPPLPLFANRKARHMLSSTSWRSASRGAVRISLTSESLNLTPPSSTQGGPLRMMSMRSTKECSLCRSPYTGYGSTCGTCRSNPKGIIRACDQCGHHYKGFGSTCSDCCATVVGAIVGAQMSGTTQWSRATRRVY